MCLRLDITLNLTITKVLSTYVYYGEGQTWMDEYPILFRQSKKSSFVLGYWILKCKRNLWRLPYTNKYKKGGKSHLKLITRKPKQH